MSNLAIAAVLLFSACGSVTLETPPDAASSRAGAAGTILGGTGAASSGGPGGAAGGRDAGGADEGAAGAGGVDAGALEAGSSCIAISHGPICVGYPNDNTACVQDCRGPFGGFVEGTACGVTDVPNPSICVRYCGECPASN